MTKEKIGVVDKIGGIEPLLGLQAPVGGLACNRFNYLRSAPRPGPWVKLGHASFKQRVAFRDFLIVVER